MPSAISARENHENKTFLVFYKNLFRNSFVSHSWSFVHGHSCVLLVKFHVKLLRPHFFTVFLVVFEIRSSSSSSSISSRNTRATYTSDKTITFFHKMFRDQENQNKSDKNSSACNHLSQK